MKTLKVETQSALYDILIEKEAEMAAIRNGKKNVDSEETNESLESVKEALGE